MKVLITNHRLALRTGTELYAGELAKALRERGHEIALFSPLCGDLAETFRGEGLSVHDRIEDLDLVPDIIHGQHHLATMTALSALPDCPAIYLCHGYDPWEEWPPNHPRIGCYAAVSGAFRRWFQRDFGIAPGNFEVIRNGIDLARFGAVREAPSRLRRALIFNNDLSEESAEFEIIADACRTLDIAVEGIGSGFGNAVADPVQILGEFDLVFASGRSAMEAIASGCAVIVHKGSELAALVTTDSLEYHWDRNFALGSRGKPITAELVGMEIDGYAPADVAETSELLRKQADQRRITEQLIDLYQRVIDSSGTTSPDAESASVAAYLQKLAGRVAEADEKFHSIREGWELTKGKRRKARDELAAAKDKFTGFEQYFSAGPIRRRLWRAAEKAIQRRPD